MNAHSIRHNQPVRDDLHPIVYRSIIGLTIWLVLSIWLLFDRGAYVGLNLAMITVFFVIVVGMPLMIALTWRRRSAAQDANPDVMRFCEWASCEFATWTGALSGREAAMQILLPIAAVSIGMTIFGLVYYFDIPNVG